MTKEPGAKLDQVASKLFSETVVPRLWASLPPCPKPTFTVVGAQPGAGKSSLIKNLASSRPVQIVALDMIEDALLATGALSELTAEEERALVGQLGWRLLRRSLDQRVCICFELPMPGLAGPAADLARSLGYYNEALVLAVPREESLTRCMERWVADPDAIPIEPEDHDDAYLRWWPFVVGVEESGRFDRLSLYDLEHRKVYDNHLGLADGVFGWVHPTEALSAFVEARMPLRTESDIELLRQRWRRLAASAPLPGLPDSETVLDLARKLTSEAIDEAARLARLRGEFTMALPVAERQNISQFESAGLALLNRLEMA